MESNPWCATGQGAPPGHSGEKREIDVISSSVPALQGPLGARIPAVARGSLKSSPFLSACHFSGQNLSRQASCLQELWPWCHVWWCWVCAAAQSWAGTAQGAAGSTAQQALGQQREGCTDTSGAQYSPQAPSHSDFPPLGIHGLSKASIPYKKSTSPFQT